MADTLTTKLQDWQQTYSNLGLQKNEVEQQLRQENLSESDINALNIKYVVIQREMYKQENLLNEYYDQTTKLADDVQSLKSGDYSHLNNPNFAYYPDKVGELEQSLGASSQEYQKALGLKDTLDTNPAPPITIDGIAYSPFVTDAFSSYNLDTPEGFLKFSQTQPDTFRDVVVDFALGKMSEKVLVESIKVLGIPDKIAEQVVENMQTESFSTDKVIRLLEKTNDSDALQTNSKQLDTTISQEPDLKKYNLNADDSIETTSYIVPTVNSSSPDINEVSVSSNQTTNHQSETQPTQPQQTTQNSNNQAPTDENIIQLNPITVEAEAIDPEQENWDEHADVVLDDMENQEFIDESLADIEQETTQEAYDQAWEEEADLRLDQIEDEFKSLDKESVVPPIQNTLATQASSAGFKQWFNLTVQEDWNDEQWEKQLIGSTIDTSASAIQELIISDGASFEELSSTFQGNLQSSGSSLVAGYIVNDALGIEFGSDLGGQVMSTVVGHTSSSAVQAAYTAATSTTSFSDAFVGAFSSSSSTTASLTVTSTSSSTSSLASGTGTGSVSSLSTLSTLGNAVGGVVGAYAAQQVLHSNTEAEMIGSAVGATVGSIVGSVFLWWLGPFGTMIGSYLGSAVGDTFGENWNEWTDMSPAEKMFDLVNPESIIDSSIDIVKGVLGMDEEKPKPEAGVTLVYNPYLGVYEIESSYGRNGGDANALKGTANNIGDSVEDLIAQIAGDGQLANRHEMPRIEIGYKGEDQFIRVDGQYVGELNSQGIQNAMGTVLKDAVIEGGDLYVNRMIHNDKVASSDVLDLIKSAQKTQTYDENPALKAEVDSLLNEKNSELASYHQKTAVRDTLDSQIAQLSDKMQHALNRERFGSDSDYTRKPTDFDGDPTGEPSEYEIDLAKLTALKAERADLQSEIDALVDFDQIRILEKQVDAHLAKLNAATSDANILQTKMLEDQTLARYQQQLNDAGADLQTALEWQAYLNATQDLNLHEAHDFDDATRLEYEILHHNTVYGAEPENQFSLYETDLSDLVFEQKNGALTIYNRRGLDADTPLEDVPSIVITDWENWSTADSSLKLSFTNHDTSETVELMPNMHQLMLQMIGLDQSMAGEQPDLSLNAKNLASYDVLVNIAQTVANIYNASGHEMTEQEALDLSFGGFGYSNGEILQGLAADDILFLNNDTTSADAGSGDDLILQSSAVSHSNGGLGSDTVSYILSTEGVNVDLSANHGSGGFAEGDTYEGIENVIGSTHDDTLRGDGAGNELSGLSGDDHLEGRAGNDTLKGGAGNDWLDGGEGQDYLDGGAGSDTVTYANTETGKNISHIVLSHENMQGDSVNGFATLTETDTLSNIEHIVATDTDDKILGNESSNSLLGKAGDDRLSGFSGNDVLFGGDGNDILEGGSGDDLLVGGSGRNTLIGGMGSDVLQAGDGQNVLLGGDGNDAAILVGSIDDYQYLHSEKNNVYLTNSNGEMIRIESVEKIGFQQTGSSEVVWAELDDLKQSSPSPLPAQRKSIGEFAIPSVERVDRENEDQTWFTPTSKEINLERRALDSSKFEQANSTVEQDNSTRKSYEDFEKLIRLNEKIDDEERREQEDEGGVRRSHFAFNSSVFSSSMIAALSAQAQELNNSNQINSEQTVSDLQRDSQQNLELSDNNYLNATLFQDAQNSLIGSVNTKNIGLDKSIYSSQPLLDRTSDYPSGQNIQEEEVFLSEMASLNETQTTQQLDYASSKFEFLSESESPEEIREKNFNQPKITDSSTLDNFLMPLVSAQSELHTLEDMSIALNIDVSGQNPNKEMLTVYIDGLPKEASLSAGVLLDDGRYQLSVKELNNLIYTPSPNSDEDHYLSIEVVSTELATGIKRSQSTSQLITIEAVSDDYQLNVFFDEPHENIVLGGVVNGEGWYGGTLGSDEIITTSANDTIHGDYYRNVPLDISVILEDNDGSEEITNLQVLNLPPNAVVIDKDQTPIHLDADGFINIMEIADRQPVSLMVPFDTGDFSIDVESTVREISNNSTLSKRFTFDLSTNNTVGGDDFIDAGNGNNTIYASGGNDTILSGEGNDTINAGNGDNTISSGQGDDYILSGNGVDTITTGNGNKTIYAGDGDDVISTQNGMDYIDAGEGHNHVSTGDGDKTVFTDSGDDQIITGDGNDVINAGAGINIVDAGDGDNEVVSEAGDDEIVSGNGDDIISAGSGDNSIHAGDGDNTITAESGQDIIFSGSGNDSINAGNGDNTISSGQGDDYILSGNGVDTITTGNGNKTIYAGDGDDVISTQNGMDYIDAGEGHNHVSTGDGDKTVFADSGNDQVITGDGNDFINAGGGKNEITAGDGENTVVTLEGNDWITTGKDNDVINAGAGINIVDAGDGDNEVVSEAGDDEIVSGNGDDIISAGSGDNSIHAGDGDNTITAESGQDIIFSGSGNDSINAGNGDNTISSGQGDDYILSGNGVDTITTGNGNKTIYAGDGDDVISTQNGMDYIDAGEGHNHVSTGDGDKTVFADSGDDQVITGDGNDFINAGGGKNEITTGDGENTVVTLEGNDWITTGKDNDVINAGAGINIVDAGDGDNEVVSEAGDDEIVSGNGDDIISAGSGDNSIHAGDGDNTITAESGQDIIFSGSGNDSINAGNGDNTISSGQGDDYILSGNGVDTITTGNGNKTIYAGDGDDVISTQNGMDYIDAGEGHNHVSTGDGDKTVFTDSGDDQIITGDGNDFINAGNGLNTIQAGNGNNNVITGTGSDEIITYSGNDVIRAGNGNNRIQAGHGNNNIVSGNGRDQIITGSGNDTIYSGSGSDNILTQGGDDYIDAGDGNNQITTGNGNKVIFADSGNDIVFTGSGDDSIQVGSGQNYIQAGEGNNFIITGNDDDEIFTGNGNDHIESGNGDDLIEAKDGQNIIYSGGGNDYIHAGNDIDFIYGETGNDIIHSYAGNDVLDGGRGKNELYAGLGDDVLITSGSDTVLNGGDGFDTVKLSGLSQTYDLTTMQSIEQIEVANTAETITIAGNFNLNTLIAHETGEAYKLKLQNIHNNATLSVDMNLKDFLVQMKQNSSYYNLIKNDFGNDILIFDGKHYELEGFKQLQFNTSFQETDTLFLDDRNNNPFILETDTALLGDFYEDGTMGYQNYTTSNAIDLSNAITTSAYDIEDGTNISIHNFTGNHLTTNYGNGIFYAEQQYHGRVDFSYAIKDSSGATSITTQNHINLLEVDDAPVVEVTTEEFKRKYNYGFGGDTHYTMYNFNIIDLDSNWEDIRIDVDITSGGASKITQNIPKLDNKEYVSGLYGYDEFDDEFNYNRQQYWITASDQSGYSGKGQGQLDYIRYQASESEDNPYPSGWRIHSQHTALTLIEWGIASIGNINTVTNWTGTHYSRSLYDIPFNYYFNNEFKFGVQNHHYKGTTDTVTPIILDLDNDGFDLSSSVSFDFNSDSELETGNWTADAQDAILVYDWNQDSLVNNASEIAFSEYHPEAETDLEGLALAFDSNQDGLFNALDEKWQYFGVWQDANFNGITDSGEFLTMQQSGISEIELTSNNEVINGDGFTIFGQGNFTYTDGTQGNFADVALEYEQTTPETQEITAEDNEESEIDQQWSQLVDQLAASSLSGNEETSLPVEEMDVHEPVHEDIPA